MKTLLRPSCTSVQRYRYSVWTGCQAAAARAFSHSLCSDLSNSLTAGKLAQLTDPNRNQLLQKKKIFKPPLSTGSTPDSVCGATTDLLGIDAEVLKLPSVECSN